MTPTPPPPATPPAPDPSRCPLCGGPNGCALATREPREGAAPACWCATATIAPAVLDRIPLDQRGLACVCRACTGQSAASNPR